MGRGLWIMHDHARCEAKYASYTTPPQIWQVSLDFTETLVMSGIPSPPGVPFLGNIFDVNPNDTWNSLNQLAKQYG